MRTPRQTLAALRRRRRGRDLGDGRGRGRYESWLTHYFDAELSAIDAACAGREPAACMPLFRGLPDGVWAMLLSGEYSSYPALRAALPAMPVPELQMRWNGSSGHELLLQSQAFYSHAIRQAAAHLGRPLQGGQVLDFGCGWGRLTRFFARDLEPGALCGCDPVEEILDAARSSGLSAELALCDFVPERLPFEAGRFDLAFSFSVFTHISEAAHRACLDAIAETLAPGGLLIATIRPPAYLKQSPQMSTPEAVERIGPRPLQRLQEPTYLFAPHPPDPEHPQAHEGEMTYGESVISAAYVRRHWGRSFELLGFEIPLVDPHQVAVTLRKLPGPAAG